jgi:predicted alpha-1,2-mannosidase
MGRSLGINRIVVLGCLMALFGPRSWPSSTFVTSFESKERPLDWADTAEVGACNPEGAAPSRVSLATHIARGPAASSAWTAKPRVGFTGLHALAYAGLHIGSGRGRACNKIFDVDLPVEAMTELSYVILPEFTDEDLRYPSTHVAVDLAFSDGTYLSSLGARDQHRVPLTAAGQGEGRILHVNQWNYVAADIGEIATGKTIKRILVAYDSPGGAGQFAGFIDDIRIGARQSHTAAVRPSDDVNTLRGTNSNSSFSRGNLFPAVAVPHGFNFWTPATDAGSDWIYQYQERNAPDNLPRIEAFALSHEPSPWMGDRQTFQVMPSSGAPTARRAARALAFRHENEVAHAHYYKVRFDNGIVAEMTPTDHAAVFRFTFVGDVSNLIFDNRSDEGGITLSPESGTLSGYSDVRSRLSEGATRLFFYAAFDRPVKRSGRLTDGKRAHVGGWFGFFTGGAATRVVTMKIASSLISVDQARRNLELEITPTDRFEDVEARAQALWDRKLGSVTVEGASHDERVTLYSNLYRLFLYPNSGFENTGTAERPRDRYASPFSKPTGANTPTSTGARLMDGRVFVNNGFWDTYRTAWPAYVLLTPREAGEMIDGFVQQYRDGGWIARWSSPGYADLMTGTSADVAFADAWLKGVQNFDVRAFYQAALKDAAVVSPVRGAGRKGLERSSFVGYADDSVDEGLSWSLDGYINDFGIANLAAALAARNDPDDPYREHYGDDARYYLNRALGYVGLFDREVGFFVGRRPDGRWGTSAKDFDPLSWGGDYTETDAWNMAFHVPQDGQGLANLYGGRAALAAKLDAFFGAPGEFNPGAYGGVIHEMLEAQAVRMGQYGHSNQPSHHILYMYDYAGEPWKTQDKVRDVLSRLYVGSEIGQGYPGDEDNGEMSAWWLWSAAGIYPLQMGRPEYVIGAPYFEHMSIQLENGKRIEVNAPGVSDRNRFVQGLKLNGQPWTKTTIGHAALAQGAVLDFAMGPTPSPWGSAPEDLPVSITKGDRVPAPLQDLTGPGRGEASDSTHSGEIAKLFDNTSDTGVIFADATPWVQYRLDAEHSVSMYTLTSGAEAGDPRSWRLEGSRDGRTWAALDERHAEVFPWRRYTRAFAVRHPGRHSYYRLTVTENSGETTTNLAELELLGEAGASAP